MTISPNVVIMTKDELDKVKQKAFVQGVERGKFEAAAARMGGEINDAAADIYMNDLRPTLVLEGCKCAWCENQRKSIIPDTPTADQPVSGGHSHGHSVDKHDQHNQHDRPPAGKN